MSHPGSVRRPWESRPVVLGGAAVVASAATVLSLVSLGVGQESDPTTAFMSIYGSIMFSFVGIVVLWQRPGQRLGRLSLAVGVAFAVSAILVVILAWWQPATGVGTNVVGAWKVVYALSDKLAQGLQAAGLLFGAVLLITWFPDGRRSSRLGLLVELALGLCIVALGIASLGDPISRQVGWSPTLDAAFTAVAALVAIGLVGTWFGAVLDLAIRYRRADRLRRIQMRWVLAAAILSGTLPIVFAVIEGLVGGIGIVWSVGILALGLPILAVAIAITRYHLYDIDRIVSATIAYSVVSVVLVGMFAAAVVVLQTTLAPFTNGDTLAVAGSTLVAAASFQPIRSRVQAAVDRHFHRARYDAERTIEAFSERMRDELDLDTLAGELGRTAARAVEPSVSSIWLRGTR